MLIHNNVRFFIFYFLFFIFYFLFFKKINLFLFSEIQWHKRQKWQDGDQ
jgi:hypothetical protein